MPLLLWDGECGFCRYWVIRWGELTGGKVRFEPYQQAGNDFPEIGEANFRKAAYLVEPDGWAYRGAAAAFRTLSYSGSHGRLMDWYRQYDFFRHLCNAAYDWMAGHRNFMMKLTIGLWGRNPRRPYPRWLLWLAVALVAAGMFIAALE